MLKPSFWVCFILPILQVKKLTQKVSEKPPVYLLLYFLSDLVLTTYFRADLLVGRKEDSACI